jgi:chromosome segregation ATPase
MTEIKKELEAIHSIKSKGAGDEEEFVLGQHYPPGVIGMKELVKCWEYHLKENKKLKEENKELRLQAFGVNCNMTGEGIILKPPTRENYIVMLDELKEEIEELKEEIEELKEDIETSEDNVMNLTKERDEYFGETEELKEENKQLKNIANNDKEEMYASLKDLQEENKFYWESMEKLKEENAELKKELLKYTKGWVEKNDKGKITKRHHSYKRLQELYDKYSPHRNKGMREFQLLDDD